MLSLCFFVLIRIAKLLALWVIWPRSACRKRRARLYARHQRRTFEKLEQLGYVVRDDIPITRGPRLSPSQSEQDRTSIKFWREQFLTTDSPVQKQLASDMLTQFFDVPTQEKTRILNALHIEQVLLEQAKALEAESDKINYVGGINVDQSDAYLQKLKRVIGRLSQ